MAQTMPTDTELELRERFLQCMSAAACTVNVVTTDGPAGRFGLTVSAMSSVSADTNRPTLLVCVHGDSASSKAILENGVFCVNVLRDDQSYISDCFAGRWKTPDGDKFSCVGWTKLTTGSPRVIDPLVAFDCRLVSYQKIGTHYVIFGEVNDSFMGAPGSPLIYANRGYGTPTRHGSRLVGERGSETLKIGAFHTFAPYIIPGLLERLAARGHSVELQLLEGDERRIMEGLKAGEVDIALLYDFNLEPGLAADPLISLKPYVLLAEGHPLASQSAISLADLAPEPMILLTAPPSGDYFLSLFKNAGLQPKVSIRTLSFEMVRSLVAHGLGFSILTTKPASAMSYDGRPLATRPLVDPTRLSRVILARRTECELSPIAAAFREVCVSLFAEQTATDSSMRPSNSGEQHG